MADRGHPAVTVLHDRNWDLAADDHLLRDVVAGVGDRRRRRTRVAVAAAVCLAVAGTATGLLVGGGRSPADSLQIATRPSPGPTRPGVLPDGRIRMPDGRVVDPQAPAPQHCVGSVIEAMNTPVPTADGVAVLRLKNTSTTACDISTHANVAAYLPSRLMRYVSAHFDDRQRDLPLPAGAEAAVTVRRDPCPKNRKTFSGITPAEPYIGVQLRFYGNTVVTAWFAGRITATCLRVSDVTVTVPGG